MKECACFAICTDPERKKMWQRIFGPLGQVPLSPVVEGWVELGPAPENQGSPYYLVDLTRLSPDEKARLIKEIAARDELPESEVISDMEKKGTLIKGTNLIITLCPQHGHLATRKSYSQYGLGITKRKRVYENHRF